jgi:corrinoid protein of di/trimethylamine methyltransferase
MEMGKDEILKGITRLVEEGDGPACAELAGKALTEGVKPLEIVDGGLSAGLRSVGEKFGRGEMFLPDMMMAVEAMKEGMKVVQPELDRMKATVKSLGTVVIGTVFGDIHDIGKSIVATMLEMSGFKVVDLGVNVPAVSFVQKVKEVKPDVLGLSALLATTMREQKEVVEAVKREGLRDRVKIIVGGAPVSEHWAREIGADGYGANAEMAVQLVRKLVT